MEENNRTTCWLCKRPLGRRIQLHHTVPKSKGGRDTVPVHPICHRTIHAHVTNAQLRRMDGSVDLLMQEVEIARFVQWIADKPADFHAPTRKTKAGRR